MFLLHFRMCWETKLWHKWKKKAIWRDWARWEYYCTVIESCDLMTEIDTSRNMPSLIHQWIWCSITKLILSSCLCRSTKGKAFQWWWVALALQKYVMDSNSGLIKFSVCQPWLLCSSCWQVCCYNGTPLNWHPSTVYTYIQYNGQFWKSWLSSVHFRFSNPWIADTPL